MSSLHTLALALAEARQGRLEATVALLERLEGELVREGQQAEARRREAQRQAGLERLKRLRGRGHAGRDQVLALVERGLAELARLEASLGLEGESPSWVSESC
jgi:hypothetical protein